ncbi:MAG: M1 family metallopeptidase [Lachnospiraceae bacterium]|nr:M1 family metallopeptidase [Lachnospiraceae bacterium]
MKNRRSLIALILTFAMAAGLLAGCGALPGRSGSGNAPQTDANGQVIPSDKGNAGGAPVGKPGDADPSGTPGTDVPGTDVSADARALLRAAAENAAPVENGCRPVRYDMDITLDPAASTIGGTCLVTLENRTTEPLSEVVFRLYSSAITQESRILSVSDPLSSQSDAAFPAEQSVDGSVWTVSLGDSAIAPGATKVLSLEFVSHIPERDDRFGSHTTGQGIWFGLTFCYPQISLLRDGVWDTDPYYDDGETEVNEMSDYAVTLHAPAEYVVAASGHQTTEADGTTRIEAENIRELGMVCCNYFTVTTRTENGVTYHQYCPEGAGLETFCESMLENTIAAVDVYSEHFGPYIYDELDIVPAYFGSEGSGMEMPGLIMNGMPAKAGEGMPAAYFESAVTTVHETAHQWFYCAVGNDQYDEAWIDESFATYASETLYELEAPEALRNAIDLDGGGDGYYYGLIDSEDPYQDTISTLRALEGLSQAEWINLPVGEYGDDYDYYVMAYLVGPCMLYELQHEMGDEVFFEMMRDYYQTYGSRISTGACFVAKVLEYDGSEAVEDILLRYLDPARL